MSTQIPRPRAFLPYYTTRGHFPDDLTDAETTSFEEWRLIRVENHPSEEPDGLNEAFPSER